MNENLEASKHTLKLNDLPSTKVRMWSSLSNATGIWAVTKPDSMNKLPWYLHLLYVNFSASYPRKDFRKFIRGTENNGIT